MLDLQSIIKQMTLEEKATLCTGASAWTTVPVERLGVPEMVVADGPHGVPDAVVSGRRSVEDGVCSIRHVRGGDDGRAGAGQ